MHRFRCDELEGLKPGASVRLEKSENAHLFKTLRAAEGERCLLMDGRGNIGEAEVAAGRTLILRSRESAAPPEPPAVHLYIAPPRRQKMDQILKQCTELGVRRIVPVICERSVSLPDSDSINGRWTELMFEACKQSGNAFVPETCVVYRAGGRFHGSRGETDACFRLSRTSFRQLGSACGNRCRLRDRDPDGPFCRKIEQAHRNQAFPCDAVSAMRMTASIAERRFRARFAAAFPVSGAISRRGQA